MPFSAYRPLFPVTRNRIYLNHAAVSPMNTDVREKMEWFLNERSFGDVEFYEETMRIRAEARELMGRLLNAEPSQIGFTHNTSEGLNWLAQSLSWKKGDEILLPAGQFPANIYPWLNLERQGVKVRFVKGEKGFVHAGHIEKAITAKTRLLAVSFVEYLSGYRADMQTLGELCRKNNIIFCVDGIQGVGAIPIDVQSMNIDFLSCGGHKWLMGPMGIGFIYMAESLQEKLTPVFAGWLGVKDAWNFDKIKLDIFKDARQVEYATHNSIGVSGLSASLEILVKAGPAAIEQHLLIMGQQLVDRLPDFGFEFVGHEDPAYWSGIYSFRHPDCEEIYNYLSNNNVVCALRSDCIRFSPHFYNTRDDIQQAIELLADWSRNH